MKSGNLNFLEPSGQLQACNGAALPLPDQYGSFLYNLKFKLLTGPFLGSWRNLP